MLPWSIGQRSRCFQKQVVGCQAVIRTVEMPELESDPSLLPLQPGLSAGSNITFDV